MISDHLNSVVLIVKGFETARVSNVIQVKALLFVFFLSFSSLLNILIGNICNRYELILCFIEN